VGWREQTQRRTRPVVERTMPRAYTHLSQDLRLRDLQRGPQVAAGPRQPQVPASRRVRCRAPRRPDHVSLRHLRGGLRAPRRPACSPAPARPPDGAGQGAAAGCAAPARSASASQRLNARRPGRRSVEARPAGSVARVIAASACVAPNHRRLWGEIDRRSSGLDVEGHRRVLMRDHPVAVYLA